MRFLVLVLAIILIGCIQNERFECRVIEVVDGDTIIVDLNGRFEKVRLLGVDTPEIVPKRNKPFEYDNITNLTLLAEFGLKAKEFTEKFLDNKTVTIEIDPLAGYRDKYGRILAYVYVNGKDLNAILLEKGYARVYISKFKKLDDYLKIQREAMIERRGIWYYGS